VSDGHRDKEKRLAGVKKKEENAGQYFVVFTWDLKEKEITQKYHK